MEYQGFWSYVRKDDEAEHGRIVQLAKDIAQQFEMLAGEPISLFLDRDDVHWGETWREKIDNGLSTVAFFVPVLTPRYFLSPECRRELQVFARAADQLGVKDLVLPLLYVDVPGLHDDEPQDDLMLLIKNFQWEDWTDLRFEDVTSSRYRRAVGRLAQRLIAANLRAEVTQIVPTTTEAIEVVGEPDGDSLGLIDRLAIGERAVPEWTETLDAISDEIRNIGSEMSEATVEMKRSDSQGLGFAGRAKVARHLVGRLKAPTDRMQLLSSQFTTNLHEVDGGIRAIIELASDEARQDQEARTAACQFFRVVGSVAENIEAAMEAVQQMVHGIAPVERMSRDLRPVMRKLRQGLTTMMEARRVSADWVLLVEESGIDCDNVVDS